MDGKGSAEYDLLSSPFDRARTSWLFIISFLIWLSKSYIYHKAIYDFFHIKTRSDTCEELHVVMSQRMETTPCERVSACRGGAAALEREML